jgi:hypothetical protein
VPTATSTQTRPSEGPVLVRVTADAPTWVRGLPAVPQPHRIGVTVGVEHLRSDSTELATRGYDLIDVVGGRRPGPHADLLVPAVLRDEHPRWFSSLLLVSERVFDLRFGPVHIALHAELMAHLPTHDGV